MKVLKVFGKLDPGGAELRTLELLTEISKTESNIEFHILVLSGEKGILDTEFENKKVKIHYIKLKKVSFLKKFVELIKNEKIDVLYSNVFLFSGIFMLLGYLLKVPKRIAHIRTLYDEKKGFLRNIRNKILICLIKNFSTQIVGVNKSVIIENFGKNQLKNKKTRILYNGFKFNEASCEKEKKNVQTEFNIIHVGRQVKAKNHIKLINIFAEITHKIPNSRLYLVGKTNEKIMNDINEILIKEKICDKVEFLGIQNDMDSIFANKDILIFPSEREGMPGVILESLKNGVPVLSSSISPHKELQEFFPSIITFDLSKSNTEWAEVAVKMRQKNFNTVSEFKKSPFFLNIHLENYLKLLNHNSSKPNINASTNEKRL